MSRSLKEIMQDVAADAAKARAEASEMAEADRVAEEQAKTAMLASLKAFNTSFDAIVAALNGIRRELSALNIKATVVADRRPVKIGSGELVDFGSLVFQVPSTIGSANERWAAVRFLFAGDTHSGTGSIQVYTSNSAGDSGTSGLSRFELLYLKDSPTSEALERLAREAFDNARI